MRGAWLGRIVRSTSMKGVGVLSARQAIVLLLSVLAIVQLAGCGASGSNKAGAAVSNPVVLTLADGEDDVSNAQPFADAVRQFSKGALQIAIKSGWGPNDPFYETDLIKDVEAGRAQLGVSASRAFDTVGIDSFDALQAPFLIDNLALERKVLASDLTGQMLAGLGPAGLVGLALLPGPLRHPLSFGQPLLSASDFGGHRVGIRASGVTAETLRALGATPVVSPRDNDITGLVGVEGHLANLDSAFPVRGATITGNIDFEPRPDVIFINRRVFDSLSATQRRVLIAAAAEVQKAGAVYEPDDGAVQDLCVRGIGIVEASPTDLATFRTAVQPVYQSLESNHLTKAFIERITTIRRADGGAPDTVFCAVATERASATQAATELDGTWEVTYTRSQYFAAGAQPGENVPGNWGHFRLAFERGRFIDAGPDVGPGSGPASGWYAVKGDEIIFHRTDDAYPGSDTEIWGPYIWSAYRDTLTFQKSKSFGQGPTGLVVKPWRRVASAN
jgi:TRAP-type C4-dicarboxylate transport system substrate-binding protein